MHIGWPQGILLAFTIFQLGVEVAGRNNGAYKFGAVLGAVVTISLLWWGGFFAPACQ